MDWLADHDEAVINLDKLTYAGSLNNLRAVEENADRIFVKGILGTARLLKNC